jgi:2-C-methyl-D-erythritol 4-phosphate cytidylyltransferase
MPQPFGAVVVAAGAGTRLESGRPKALYALDGTPLVRRATEAMAIAGADPVIVVISPGYHNDFAEAVAGSGVTRLIEGGRERTHSVVNGLDAIAALPAASRPRYLLVHDAARPLVPQEVVHRVVEALRAGAPAVVPAIEVTDSIRRLTSTGSAPVDRGLLRSVQTPQGFDLDTLIAAYRLIGDEVVTDDATVCERAGHPVTLVDGAAEAFKITHRSDLFAAAAMLQDSPRPPGGSR